MFSDVGGYVFRKLVQFLDLALMPTGKIGEAKQQLEQTQDWKQSERLNSMMQSGPVCYMFLWHNVVVCRLQLWLHTLHWLT